MQGARIAVWRACALGFFVVVMCALRCVCSRNTNTPSVVATKRPTPKVLQRIAHAPFAAGENGLLGYVGRVGADEDDEKQRAEADATFGAERRDRWHVV